MHSRSALVMVIAMGIASCGGGGGGPSQGGDDDDDGDGTVDAIPMAPEACGDPGYLDEDGDGDVNCADDECADVADCDPIPGGAITGQSPNGHSMLPVVSGNGRYVAFSSLASNLVSGDTNGVLDVFVHDRVLKTNTRVNVTSAGGQVNGQLTPGPNFFAQPSSILRVGISANGRIVCFISTATNLVANDTNGQADVFVHDLDSGVTERVSVASDGSQATASGTVTGTQSCSISGDGRYVAFVSDLDGLTSMKPIRDATYLHDRVAGTTEVVSLNNVGEYASRRTSWPSVSGDGRYVAFSSDSVNLGGSPTTGFQAYVRDRMMKTTTLLTHSSVGYADHRLMISLDGSKVAAMVRNNDVGAVRVQTSLDGQLPYPPLAANADDGPMGGYATMSISSSGDKIAYSSRSNGRASVFDDDVGMVVPLGPQFGSPAEPSLSGDGRYVAYSLLVDNVWQIFVDPAP